MSRHDNSKKSKYASLEITFEEEHLETLKLLNISLVQDKYQSLLGVIEELPVTVVRMFGVRCVVSAVESAAVVADGVAAVGAAGHAVRVAGQAQPRQREVHHRAHLLPRPLRAGEPLEVDHQDLGQPVQRVPLRALPPRLTCLTRLKLVFCVICLIYKIEQQGTRT